MTNREIAHLVYDRVCGTPQDVMMVIDDMIEEREISIEHFHQNEMEIMGIIDEMMFCCEICGWNVESSEVSMEASDIGNLVCCNCGGDNES